MRVSTSPQSRETGEDRAREDGRHGEHLPLRAHPTPWWFRLLSRLAPSRCREIPEATEPERVLLRQFAIVHRVCYLQQFASGENPRYYHRHEFRRVWCLVLSGGYWESRPGAEDRFVSAPMLYSMTQQVLHRVTRPLPGHTSIFFGWSRNGERVYFREYSDPSLDLLPIPWQDHVKQQVKRI